MSFFTCHPLGHVTKSINEVIVILYASSPAGALSLSTGLVSSCHAKGLLPSELTVHREDNDCKSSLLKLACVIIIFWMFKSATNIINWSSPKR